MIRICQEFETGNIVAIYEDGSSKTFARPREIHDAVEIAQSISEDPEVQRETARVLLRALGLVSGPPAPDPVPEAGEP